MRHWLGQVVTLGRQVVTGFIDDDALGLAAEVAYRLVFALPPLVIFFASLSGVVSRYTEVDVFRLLRDQLNAVPLPAAVQDVIDLVLDAAQRESSTSVLSVGAILALWTGSGVAASLLKAFNRAYSVTEQRSFITSRLLAMALTVGLTLSVVVAFVLLVFGERVGAWLIDQLGFGSGFASAWGIVRWVAIVAFFGLSLAAVYWVGPAIEKSFVWVLPGTVAATVFWLIATWGVGLYLRLVNPGSAYGGLGTVVVLMFFLYVSAIVLLIGAEINAVVGRTYDERLKRALQSAMVRAEGRPGAMTSPVAGARAAIGRVSGWIDARREGGRRDRSEPG